MNGRTWRTRFAVGLAVGWAAFIGAAECARADYRYTEITKPGAAVISLFDINNSGVMVGYSAAGLGPTDFSQGFIYDGTSFTTLGGPAGSIWSAAMGISDGGTVVGNFYSEATVDASSGVVTFGPSRGFIYDGLTYTVFDIAGATDTFLRGISPDGRYYSGYYRTTASAGIGFVYDSLWGTLAAVSLPDSLLTIAQGINAAGVVVGSDILRGPPLTRPGFTYDIATGTRTDQSIAGAIRTAFRAIDDAGTLAGWFIDASFVTHGFVGSAADFEQLDFAGAAETYVQGSNNSGVLVGGFCTAGGCPAASRAFVATPDSVADRLLRLAAAVVGVGPGRSLADKVALAQVYVGANDFPAACAVLTDFVNEVRAQSGKKISSALAGSLTADAGAIMTAIGCH